MENNFITHFSKIEDPRESNKRHQLIDILFLAVCSVLSGAEGWEKAKCSCPAKINEKSTKNQIIRNIFLPKNHKNKLFSRH